MSIRGYEERDIDGVKETVRERERARKNRKEKEKAYHATDEKH